MFILGVVLLVVAGIVSLVGSVMLVIAAFRESTVWGVCVLLVPFAALVFVILRWSSAKRSVIVSAASFGCALAGFGLILGGASSALSAAASREMRALPNRPQPAEPAPARAVETTPASFPERTRRTDTVELPPLEPVRASRHELPEVVPVVVPPMPEFESITPATLHKHVGEDLVFEQRDGRRVAGKLIAVEPQRIRIERSIGGGFVGYEIAREELAQVHTR